MKNSDVDPRSENGVLKLKALKSIETKQVSNSNANHATAFPKIVQVIADFRHQNVKHQ